jgi:hypothetical protein
MERNVLESIPDIQELLEALTKAGVADLVWGVLGGNPASYLGLKKKWLKAGKQDIVPVVEMFVKARLKEAVKSFNEATETYPFLVPVYEKFKTVDELRANAVKKLPADKVLRLVVKEKEDNDVVVPSSPAMALVMRYSVGGESPPFEVVRKALGTKT